MKQCEICGKGSVVRWNRKKLRGKFNPTHKERKYPNLQKALIKGEKVLVCAQCIKTAAKAAK